MIVHTESELRSLQGTWKLDPQRTSVTFRARLLGLIRAAGTLTASAGGVHVGGDGEVSGTFVIEPGSVDSGNDKRDDHLRSPDLFHVEKYPTITFTVTGARVLGPNEVEVSGQVEVRGTSTPLSLVSHIDTDGRTATLTTTVPVDKRHLGIKKLNLAKAKITVNAHFDRT